MRIGSIIILIFFSLTYFSCESQQIASGCQTTHYLSGTKESEGCYKNYSKDGTWRYYFPNGKIHRVENYKAGVKSGRFLSYDQDGQLSRDITYKNGHFFDTIKFFYANGKVNFKQYYDDKGLAEGEFKLWYPSGKLSQIGSNLNGKMVGKWIKYYENGVVDHTAYYDDAGDKDSVWIYYDIKGQLLKREKYRSDSLLKVDSLSVNKP